MTPIIAIVAIAAIVIVGMSLGIDGILRASGLAMIAGIGGYKVHPAIDRLLKRVK